MNVLPLFRLFLLAVIAAIAAFPAAAATVTVFAIRTATPGSDPAGQDVDADNRLRAYAAAGQRIDGWMAFDVSDVLVPGSAVIVTGARLTLYAEGNVAGSALQSVAGLPSVGVWYSGHDDWERGGSGFPAAPDARISGPGHTGPFSSESRTALDIDLLASPAANWTSMLADSELSLIVRLDNDTAGENRVYWYGSGERPGDNTAGGNAGDDPVGPGGSGAFAPRLTLEVEVIPEPGSLPLAFAAALYLLFRRNAPPGGTR